mgnify:CR=1 FL=1|tara:strand:- start:328 stop:558 length:231 start_codon:yes stop_codon:yes gene_type:complete
MNQETINNKNLDRFDKINKRLDRLEETIEVLVSLLNAHSEWLERVNGSIEFTKRMTEDMYEEQTGLDVITGEKLDE